MTVAYRAGVTGSGSSSSAAGTIPATVQSGDVMVLVASFKAATGGAAISTPSGWTALDTGVNMTGAVGQAASFVRVATGADASSTLTVAATGSTQQLDFAMAAYSGSNGTVRSHGLTDQGASGTTFSCPSQTPSAGDLVVILAGTRGAANGAYTFTGPGGTYTIRQQVSSAAGAAQNAGAVIGDGTASGSQTVTASISVWAIAGQVIIEAASTSHPTTATPTVTTTFAAGATDIRKAAAAPTVTTTASAAGHDTRPAVAAFGVTATLVPAGHDTRPAAATPAVTVGLVVTPAASGSHAGAATPTVTTTLIPVAHRIRQAAAAFGVATTAAAAGKHVDAAAAAPAVTATLVLTSSEATHRPAAAAATVTAALAVAAGGISGSTRDLDISVGEPRTGWNVDPPTLGWNTSSPRTGWTTSPART